MPGDLMVNNRRDRAFYRAPRLVCIIRRDDAASLGMKDRFLRRRSPDAWCPWYASTARPGDSSSPVS